jgi:hypothetical protein
MATKGSKKTRILVGNGMRQSVRKSIADGSKIRG